MKYDVRKITTVICVIYVPKDLKIWLLIKQLLTKYHFFFTKLLKISHIYENCSRVKINESLYYGLLLTFKFYGRDISRIYFFIFPTCDPLKKREVFIYSGNLSGQLLHQIFFLFWFFLMGINKKKNLFKIKV